MSDTPLAGASKVAGAPFVRTLAALVIVVAGLKASTAIVLPLLTATFVALICVHPVRRLRQKGVPNVLAIGTVFLLFVLALFLLTALVGNSVREFSGSIARYDARFDEIVHGVSEWLREMGLDIRSNEFEGFLNPDKLLRLVANTASGALSTLGDIVVIVLIAVFILLEAQGLPRKLRLAAGDPDADLSNYSAAAQSVHEYLYIKTWISLLTGVIVTVFLMVVGIDYPLLWGLVAFLFNYIPTIGSVIAAAPAVLLALLQQGWTGFLVVALGYLAVNLVIGNVLEPRILGKRMGLSPLVVVVSLLFWNWVLGPIGMLLSVPLTTVIRIWLAQTEDGRAIAVLLGPSDDPQTG